MSSSTGACEGPLVFRIIGRRRECNLCCISIIVCCSRTAQGLTGVSCSPSVSPQKTSESVGEMLINKNLISRKTWEFTNSRILSFDSGFFDNPLLVALSSADIIPFVCANFASSEIGVSVVLDGVLFVIQEGNIPLHKTTIGSILAYYDNDKMYLLASIILICSSNDIGVIIGVREICDIQELDIGDGISSGIDWGHALRGEGVVLVVGAKWITMAAECRMRPYKVLQRDHRWIKRECCMRLCFKFCSHSSHKLRSLSVQGRNREGTNLASVIDNR
jgi:hypothetical protein